MTNYKEYHEMDRDYTTIAVLVVISTIAVLVAKVYFGNTTAGLATITATIFVTSKCLLVLLATIKQEKNAPTKKNGSEDISWAPVGKMSQFP